MKHKKSDCVAIVSGGMDSVVMLYLLLRLKHRPLVLMFNYNQRHSKELEYATYHALKNGLAFMVLQADVLKGMKTSALTSKRKLPHTHYTHKTQRATVVPNRNMVMLSMAVAVAEDRGLKEVYYGAHRNDLTIYPDCRPDFVRKVSAAAQSGTYNKVRIVAPFLRLLKRRIALIGLQLGVDLSTTWSCYEGGATQCGKCATCQERNEAIAWAKKHI